MTPLAANDGRVICRIQLTGNGRWVSVALALGDAAPANQFLVRADRLLYEMSGIDEAARQYDLSNWQGGIISGARYAFRVAKVPIQQVCLHELCGQLSSGDVAAVSSAAALAVARLIDRPEVPLNLDGWTVEEIPRPQRAERIDQRAKGVSPQTEAREQRANAEDQPAAPPLGNERDQNRNAFKAAVLAATKRLTTMERHVLQAYVEQTQSPDGRVSWIRIAKLVSRLSRTSVSREAVRKAMRRALNRIREQLMRDGHFHAAEIPNEQPPEPHREDDAPAERRRERTRKFQLRRQQNDQILAAQR